MNTPTYWIEGNWPGRLAVIPRPRGGEWLEDEVRSWRSAAVDVVVSLLTPQEVDEFDLHQEQPLCEALAIKYVSFPVPDRGVPASRQVTWDLVRKLDHGLAEGKVVALHCRAGIGRSSLIAACLLVFSGLDTETAWQRVQAARGCPVPDTPEQRQWVEEFAHAVSAV